MFNEQGTLGGVFIALLECFMVIGTIFSVIGNCAYWCNGNDRIVGEKKEETKMAKHCPDGSSMYYKLLSRRYWERRIHQLA